MIAVVERAEREVVVEFGVPLNRISLGWSDCGKGGRLTAFRWECLGWKVVRAC